MTKVKKSTKSDFQTIKKKPMAVELLSAALFSRLLNLFTSSKTYF